MCLFYIPCLTALVSKFFSIGVGGTIIFARVKLKENLSWGFTRSRLENELQLIFKLGDY